MEASTPGYTWSSDVIPFHSSYDHWHIFGLQHLDSDEPPTSPKFTSSPPIDGGHRPSLTIRSSSSTTRHDSEETIQSLSAGDAKRATRRVVARVSRHAVRIEREFQLCKRVTRTSDREAKRFVRPIQFVHLPASVGEEELVASIFETPGPNYLRELVSFGPNSYRFGQEDELSGEGTTPISLQLFMTFAIGATECCEIMHHEHQLVHGELRSDAFHFCEESGEVKLVNFGSGARAFQDGLTSAGWSALSQEVGVRHKLTFIAPEQTGRLPAEPDSRTDIYSLGILFWTMLTGQSPFEGDTPLEIMQGVLSRRVPSVSSKRIDVPEILSALIRKMTQKNIDDRYNSASGLKHDLVQIQRLLGDGNSEGLQAFTLGGKDVSSYFMLPNSQIGRVKERQTIIKIIERVAKQRRRQALQGRRSKLGSSSSTTDSRPDYTFMEDARSESSSSTGRESRLNSFSQQTDPKRLNIGSQESSPEFDMSTIESTLERPSFEAKYSADSKASYHSSEPGQRSASTYGTSEGAGSKLRNAHRAKRKGYCEVVSISGVGGSGKSVLVQSIQAIARSHGYFASAKFDQAKRVPFEPVLRVTSSLFRQIFSESDVNTEFHQNVRNYVRGAWGILHSHLGLPVWLLGPMPSSERSVSRTLSSRSARTSSEDVASPVMGSTPHIAATPNALITPNNVGNLSGTHANSTSTNTTAEWLRAGGTAMSSRFSNTFLDVLHALAVQKLICLCLDDLQYADEESLDLLLNIIDTKIPIVLILTYRSEETLSPKVQTLLDSATNIALQPFEEAETAEYVSLTLHRSLDYILPLVAVVQEKCGGNPFMVRELLSTCYRTGCIYYCWKNSQWEYDLDKVFTEFASHTYGSQISNDFILKRLQDLPQDARALLAWASLIGDQFSFDLIKMLMSCNDPTSLQIAPHLPLVRCRNPVFGLQSALSSYFIMSGDDEDRFKFSHDRYMQAASSLEECESKAEMHFLIAQTMMSMNSAGLAGDPSLLYTLGRHICMASDLIKEKIKLRAVFRDILYQVGENSCDSGAKSTGLSYFLRCIKLLQDEPWNNELADVFYNETLTIYTRTAEVCWYLGDFDQALHLLHAVLDNADAFDKTPAYVLLSRVLSQKGDTEGAFRVLKQSLAEMGKDIPKMSWEDCDTEFHRLRNLLRADDAETRPSKRSVVNQDMIPIGAILVEITSAAFWSDALLFYQMSLQMLQIYLDFGLFPQAGIGFVNLASVAVGRFNDTKFGIQMGNTAKDLFNAFEDDAYTVGRGRTLHCLFIGHLEAHIREQLPILEEALENVHAGDRILTLQNLGVSANLKLASSHDLADVEAYCNYCPEEYKDWQKEMRGGAFLTATKQLARALQGKTKWQSAQTLFCDDEHDTQSYIDCIAKTAANPRRPKALYNR